ncbi:MAG TPA: sulfatase-like hydrolase/transferase [Candidatus Bathyarchaeia archaeon]|nr:sulfatase-like hydrolase/transferase [Candidatus Bathyarchaeia archaeon]
MTNSRWFARAVIVVAVAAHLSAALPGQAAAAARCTEHAEIEAFVASLKAALGCAQTRLTAGASAPCAAPSPPACAVDAQGEILSLLYPATPASGVERSALDRQLHCQEAIAAGAEQFVASRLEERVAGHRGELGSRRALDSIRRACSIEVAADPRGDVLPALGSPCAEQIGAAKAKVAEDRVVSCLRPALERIVNQVAPQPLAPNLVVVLTDDQRWDTLSYMPNVEHELVDRGVEFRQSFVTTSLCCPSRASLYSGQYAHHHGVRSNFPPLGGAGVFDPTSTLPVWLSAVGYRTALFGKYMNANYVLAPKVPRAGTSGRPSSRTAVTTLASTSTTR